VSVANTRSATFSIRLKPETKRRLAKLAKACGRSSNLLIADAVESYVADQGRMLAEIRQADRQVKSGHYIKHQDMKSLSGIANWPKAGGHEKLRFAFAANRYPRPFDSLAASFGQQCASPDLMSLAPPDPTGTA